MSIAKLGDARANSGRRPVAVDLCLAAGYLSGVLGDGVL